MKKKGLLLNRELFYNCVLYIFKFLGIKPEDTSCTCWLLGVWVSHVLLVHKWIIRTEDAIVKGSFCFWSGLKINGPGNSPKSRLVEAKNDHNTISWSVFLDTPAFSLISWKINSWFPWHLNNRGNFHVFASLRTFYKLYCRPFSGFFSSEKMNMILFYSSETGSIVFFPLPSHLDNSSFCWVRSQLDVITGICIIKT